MVFKEINIEYSDSIVKLCVEHYIKLPKTGKPVDCEWTVVAAVVEDTANSIRVVSLGTGSKCLGRNALSNTGQLLNDAHAEVIARRGFLIYLYSEISSYYRNKTSNILEKVGGALKMKSSVRYLFVISSVPCGDAAIMPKTRSLEVEDGDTPTKKQRLDFADLQQTGEIPTKKQCLNSADIHRTGAKCLPSELQDPKLPGVCYHVVGVVRTKPGRGDPTASVSCSDKLARWNAVGIQGALLSLLLPTSVCCCAIVIGGGGSYSFDSMERAINSRIGYPLKTKIMQSTVTFPIIRSDVRQRPAPSSICWNISTNTVQVCVNGRKLGATKSKPGQAALEISKYKLLQRFHNAVDNIDEKIEYLDNVKSKSYSEIKKLNVSYLERWRVIVRDRFKSWTEKPQGLENFKLES